MNLEPCRACDADGTLNFCTVDYTCPVCHGEGAVHPTMNRTLYQYDLAQAILDDDGRIEK